MILLIAAVALLYIYILFNFVVWPEKVTGWGLLIFSGIFFVFLIYTMLKKR